MRARKFIVGAALLVTVIGLTSCVGTPNAETPTSRPTATQTETPTPTPTVAAIPGQTPITITAGDVVITAFLNDSQVAQDFAASLPATLPWYRNIGIEYISELPAPMTETGPFYTDVQPGHIVYYNPMDSITIIYAETGSVPTLTLMGQITSDLSVFAGLPDNVDMLIELT